MEGTLPGCQYSTVDCLSIGLPGLGELDVRNDTTVVLLRRWEHAQLSGRWLSIEKVASLFFGCSVPWVHLTFALLLEAKIFSKEGKIEQVLNYN